MNAAEKKELRIAIAKDVLKRLRGKKLIPLQGTYVRPANRVFDLFDDEDSQQSQAQKHLDKLTDGCRVCALGAMFCSYVALKNKAKVFEFLNSDSFYDVEYRLKQAFSYSQLELIEGAFEGTWIQRESQLENADEIMAFVDKYACPRERMRAIMKNIIKNDGTFVLPAIKNPVET